MSDKFKIIAEEYGVSVAAVELLSKATNGTVHGHVLKTLDAALRQERNRVREEIATMIEPFPIYRMCARDVVIRIRATKELE